MLEEPLKSVQGLAKQVADEGPQGQDIARERPKPRLVQGRRPQPKDRPAQE